MTNFEYYTEHVIPVAFRHIRRVITIWKDLMTGNYKDYVLIKTDDPFTECYGWFWEEINDSGILEKEFLEYLFDQVEGIKNGTIKTIPMDETFFDDIKKEFPEMDWDE